MPATWMDHLGHQVCYSCGLVVGAGSHLPADYRCKCVKLTDHGTEGGDE